MKGRALLFGLNYAHCKEGKLNGCINDVKQMQDKIQSLYAHECDITVYTDDNDLVNTSYNGIIKNLYNLAIQSYKDKLDFVWIHYSGHGSYQRDTSGDELDYMDEGLVPSDYEHKGLLCDDILNHIIGCFNPATKILFICDSCHSGSILDFKFGWNINTRQSNIENKNCDVTAKAILISGCMDNQTSADAYNLLNDKQHIGALTASILKVLHNKPQQLYDVFSFVSSVRKELRVGGFSQIASLSSTYDIAKEPCMIPISKILDKQEQQLQTDVRKNNYYEANTTYVRSMPNHEKQSSSSPPLLYPVYIPVIPCNHNITYIYYPVSQMYYL